MPLKILKQILVYVCRFTAVMFVLCGIVCCISLIRCDSDLPMLLGTGASVVMSGSMEGELKDSLSAGDLIVFRTSPEYSIGDIVVYKSADSYTVHRIVDIDADLITAKGDSNNVNDIPIAVSDVKGKVIFHIPYAGHIFLFLKSPIGISASAALVFIFIQVSYTSAKKTEAARLKAIRNEIERLEGISGYE